MDSFAITFSKAVSDNTSKPTMVILATPTKITAYGLPGFSGSIIDSMNENFEKIPQAEIAREATKLKTKYLRQSSTGYGSSVTVVPYAENKRMIDGFIRQLSNLRADVLTGRKPGGRV